MLENILFVFSSLSIFSLAIMSPWPDFFMIVKNSISHGRMVWFYTAFGIAFWILVHVTYCMLGLALVISQSIILFNTIKIAWALYLMYIWYQAFKSTSSLKEIDINTEKNTWETFSNKKAFLSWFLTNVLNPKATMFFLSFFTFVITPWTSYYLIWTVIFTMFLMTIIWFSLVSFFLTHQKFYNKFIKFEKIFNKIFGWLLIAIGLKIAVTK